MASNVPDLAEALLERSILGGVLLVNRAYHCNNRRNIELHNRIFATPTI